MRLLAGGGGAAAWAALHGPRPACCPLSTAASSPMHALPAASSWLRVPDQPAAAAQPVSRQRRGLLSCQAQAHAAAAAPSSSASSSSKFTTIPVTAAPQRSRVAAYEGLTSDDFRHPLDQQNTRLLRALPGLELVAKNLMGPVAEQVLLLENIGTSVLVGPDQLPSLHALLTSASALLAMDPPDLYVRQNPVPNAYTLALAGRKPFIVVHTAMLDLLTPPEVQAVLAHELGHLKCDHGLWLTVAHVLASGTLSVLPLVAGPVEDGLLRWLRAAELTCDRAALLVAQDHRVVISALMKLAGGSPSFAAELNIDAFLRQARSYDEATASPLGWYLRNAQTRSLSHPLPVMRAREIDRWAQSAQYSALLSKHRRARGGAGSSSSVLGGAVAEGAGAAGFQGVQHSLPSS